MKHLISLLCLLLLPACVLAQTSGQNVIQKKNASAGFSLESFTLGNSQLIGRTSGGTLSGLTLGSGLSLSGTTLSASGSSLTIGTTAITGGTSGHVLYNNAGTLGGIDLSTLYASLSGSYSNPAWITSLAWSKISGTPTTLVGYGITDAQPLTTNLTSIGALANSAGVLANDGSGTFSYTGTSNGGAGAADAGKVLVFDSTGQFLATGRMDIKQSTSAAPGTLFLWDADGTNWVRIRTATDVTTNITLNPPTAGGTLIGSGDTGTVTNTMLAGSIALSKLATSGTANSTTYLRGDGAWTAIDLSAYLTTATAASTYLPLAGGTLTGVLVHPAGSASAPSITGSDSDSGIYFSTTNQIDFSTGGTRKWYIDSSGTLQGGSSSIQLSGNTLGTYFFARGGYYAIGASDDVIMSRDAAARMQMGADHASTATNQTIKAHDVTTGTGASLDLRGGNGSAAGGTVTISTSATTTPAVRMTVKASGVINMSGMPTSDAGLSSGDLWNNSGVINIVP